VKSQSYAFRLDHQETKPDGQKVAIPYYYLAFTQPAEAYLVLKNMTG